MAAQSQWIPEWGSVPLNWTIMSTGLSLRDPGGSFFLMLLIAAATVPVALLRKQLGAAVFLSGATVLAVEHIRFEALFGIVTVVVGADVLTSAVTALQGKVKKDRSVRYGTHHRRSVLRGDSRLPPRRSLRASSGGILISLARTSGRGGR
jgi:hypothetical protein